MIADGLSKRSFVCLLPRSLCRCKHSDINHDGSGVLNDIVGGSALCMISFGSVLVLKLLHFWGVKNGQIRMFIFQ